MKKSFVGKMAQKAMNAVGKVLSDYSAENGVLQSYKGKNPDFVVPQNVEAIGGAVFFYNGNHVKTVTIPAHVREIDPTAFMSCTSIETFIVSVENPYFCTVDGALLTKDGSRLLKVPATKREYTVPDTVREFEVCAFDSCELLQKVTIPAGITKLDSRAFFGCYALEEVIVPEGVVSIGEHAFGQCRSLKRVELPSNLETLHPQAFYDTPELTEIMIHESHPRLKSVDGVLMSRDGSTLKAVPAARTAYDVPEGVTEIGEYAFFCGELEQVSIPDSVRVIGNHAFHSCTKLQRVVLPEGVETIGAEAFHFCHSMTEISIPDSVVTIGNCAFYSSGIRSLRIPAKLRVIPMRMCEHCINLRELTVPAQVEWIDHHAFARCENLESVVLSEGLIAIGDGAFSKCLHLRTINIPRSVTEMGEDVFEGSLRVEVTVHL